MLRPVLGAIILAALLCSASTNGSAREASPSATVSTGSTIEIPIEAQWLRSDRTSLSPVAKASTDTVDLYGGPGTPEGKFELAGGVPDRQGWVGVDLTDFNPELEGQWQVDTFNAETLGGFGPGNHALWCGRSAAQEPGWISAPGYGNNWFSSVVWSSGPLADPTNAQDVQLSFYFHHDTEPGYDYFQVQYERSGLWIDVLRLSGTDRSAPGGPFPEPGLRFSDVATGLIHYDGNDYGGPGGDEIRLRLVVSSDGAWSDEDGLQDTDGAVQIDDIIVDWEDAPGATLQSRELFEGPGPYPWTVEKLDFVGEFSKVLRALSDLDPCRSNFSPVMTFIDDGTPPSNAPGQSTGGSFSPDWSYGDAAGHTTAYDGGLAVDPDLQLHNVVVSPPIAWDLPGPEDDGPEWVGAVLEFDVWAHTPFLYGIAYGWAVRSSTDGGVSWGQWQDYGSGVYYRDAPEWVRGSFNVGELLEPGLTHVQISLRAQDWSRFLGLQENGTPGPWYDNVRLRKVRQAGVSLLSREIDQANDGFPFVGSVDVSTVPARDALDVRFDMARDVNTGALNFPGDSVIVDAVPLIPGTSLQDLRMVWVLDRNPLFEDAIRLAPSRTVDENVDTSDPVRWTGEVMASPSTTANGNPIQDRWFFDLPDEDFLYPGDVLRYYLRATDSDGRVSTLPADLSAFEQGWPYDPTFVVRALPSLRDVGWTQPPILIWNDFGSGTGQTELQRALQELAMVPGIDLDLYTTKGARSGVSNGLGSTGAHGAGTAHLDGYRAIVYLAEDQRQYLLSDGTDDQSPGGSRNDKSTDLSALLAWRMLPGDRGIIYFSDHLASYLDAGNPIASDYLTQTLGASLVSDDLGSAIDDQRGPGVIPSNPAFAQPFVAFRDCPPRGFDHLSPIAPAVAGHAFVDPAGVAYPGVPGSIVHDRFDGEGDRQVDILLPFGLSAVRTPMNKEVSFAARTDLLRELFDYVAVPTSGGFPSAAPSARSLALRLWPNPFNPSTEIRLSLPRAAMVEVRVLNLRGERVRQLHRGTLEPGERVFTWDGVDEHGTRVASGVYLVEARAGDERRIVKAALVK